MTLIDRLRVEHHVQRYDFWLDVYSVPGRKRRDLVRELRGNIAEAAADLGTPTALRRLGSPKSMAAQAGESLADPTRPSWGAGIAVGLAAGAVYLVAQIFALFQFAAGVSATGMTSTAYGSLLGYPGVTASAHIAPDAMWVGAEGFPWLLIPIFVVGLAVGAKSWRVITRRHGSANADRSAASQIS